MIKLISSRSVEGYESATWQECVDYFDTREGVAFDTETSSMLPFNGYLYTVQLGDAERQYVIDWLTMPNVEALRHILLTNLVLAHNMKFDWKWAKSLGIDIRRFYDTFIGESILTTGFEPDERGLGLGVVVEKYTDGHLHKEDRGKINYMGLTPTTIEYCAGDVRYLHEIREKQLERIKKHGLEAIEQLEMKATRVLAIMEYNGVVIDTKIWNEVADETEKNVVDQSILLDNILREEPKLSQFRIHPQLNMDLFETGTANDTLKDNKINWSSASQKLAVLHKLGIPLKSADKQDLLKLRKRHPIVPAMIEYSKQFKLASSFGHSFLKEFLNPVTNRVHPDYFQIVSTGRISCSNPNLLNIPAHGPLGKKIRSAFIARPGYKIVGGDYSGMELRVIAEFAEDPLWDEILLSGKDLHSELCARTFDIPLSKVKDPFFLKPEITYRDVQKTIDFGLAYGMSKYKLAYTIDTTPDKAEQIIRRFFKVVPNVEKFLNILGEVAKESGYIRTPAPYRRIRWFPYHADAVEHGDFALLGSIERAGKNAPIQGCNGDIIKQALVNLQDEIDEHNHPLEIRLAVYDEIRTESREDFAEEASVLINRIMVETAQTVIHRIPIIADVTINDCWTK